MAEVPHGAETTGPQLLDSIITSCNRLKEAPVVLLNEVADELSQIDDALNGIGDELIT